MSTPAYAIAHTVLPNLMKLKGATTVVAAIERKDASMFQQVWAAVPHAPQLIADGRGAYRIGVITLPAPKQMGEAHMCAFVAKTGDTSVARYFLLEHTYVLATKSDQVVLSERDGRRQVNRGSGPKPTGDAKADATAFVDAIMNLIEPKAVDANRAYK